MHECKAMQILKIYFKKIKKKNGHKRFWDKAQGPYQKDSLRLSLLHPHLLRCKLRIGVLIQIGLMINSSIGIKV